MRVGRHEVYWHRPLVAYLSAAHRPARRAAGRPARLPHRLPTPTSPTWPSPSSCGRACSQREPHVDGAASSSSTPARATRYQTALNVRKLLDTRAASRRPAAAALVRPPAADHAPSDGRSTTGWTRLPDAADDPERGRRLAERAAQPAIEPAAAERGEPAPPESLTFDAPPGAPSRSATGRRSPTWRRAGTSTRTTPTACATRRRRSMLCRTTTATSTPWATTCSPTTRRLVAAAG